jgi:hypothetical protein
MAVAGVGAIVLGILSLTQIGPVRILMLVALLAVATAEVIGGSTALSRLRAGR